MLTNTTTIYWAFADVSSDNNYKDFQIRAEEPINVYKNYFKSIV